MAKVVGNVFGRDLGNELVDHTADLRYWWFGVIRLLKSWINLGHYVENSQPVNQKFARRTKVL
jgi:lysozyme family protein